VVGRKYVRLYHPEHSPQLHPHTQGPHTNSSQIDINRVDRERFPDFPELPYYDVYLEAGEMLYIPPRFWHYVEGSVSPWFPPVFTLFSPCFYPVLHYVQGLETSFSVSFWWGEPVES